MEKLSASLEDYLETICNFTKNNNKVRAIDISKSLDVSRASVTEALTKLAKKGYINHEHYGNISLTEKGEKIAKEIVSRHETLQIFFNNILELPEAEAAENACRIEHVITDNALNKIKKYLEDKRGDL